MRIYECDVVGCGYQSTDIRNFTSYDISIKVNGVGFSTKKNPLCDKPFIVCQSCSDGINTLLQSDIDSCVTKIENRFKKVL